MRLLLSRVKRDSGGWLVLHAADRYACVLVMEALLVLYLLDTYTHRRSTEHLELVARMIGAMSEPWM
jgi:hypothetical protein